MILAKAPRHGISEAFQGHPGAAVVGEVLRGADIEIAGDRLRVGLGGATLTRGRFSVFNCSETAIKAGSLMHLEEIGGRLVVVAVGFPPVALPGGGAPGVQASA